jgi:hypothetical protein
VKFTEESERDHFFYVFEERSLRIFFDGEVQLAMAFSYYCQALGRGLKTLALLETNLPWLAAMAGDGIT